MTETGITTQKQGKPSDCKSVACTNSDDNQERRGRVLAAVGGYYQAQRRGKRRTRKRQGYQVAGSIQRAATQLHRHADGLPGTQIGKARPLTKSITPQSLHSRTVHNTNTYNLPAGVKLL